MSNFVVASDSLKTHSEYCWRAVDRRSFQLVVVCLLSLLSYLYRIIYTRHSYVANGQLQKELVPLQ